MTNSTCRSCRSSSLEQYLDLGSTPLADAFPTDPDEHQPVYPLRVAVCAKCWLVQLMDDVPDDLLFGEDYGFFTGSSPALLGHFARYADWLASRFSSQCRRGITEIACNDGTLMSQLQGMGYSTTGFDPAVPAARAAQKKGLAVFNDPFSLETALEHEDLVGKQGVVIANNVIAHVVDPDDLIAGAKALLHPEGVLVLEFQYLRDLIQDNQWDLFYHEHRSFFTIASISAILERYDMRVISAEPVGTQGGSMRVVASADPSATITPGPYEPQWLQGWETYGSQQKRVDLSVEQLLRVMAPFSDIAGYGASAKATTLLHYAGITDRLRAVLDVTPSKIGRYMPGTRIPIVEDYQSPARLMLVRNYLEKYLVREQSYYDQGGKTIFPLAWAWVSG